MTVSITDVTGVGPATAKTLAKHKIRTVPDLATASEEDLSAIPGYGGGRGQRLVDAARALLAQGESSEAQAVADSGGSAGGDTESVRGKKGKKKDKEDKKRKGKKDKKRKGKGKKDKKGKGKG